MHEKGLLERPPKRLDMSGWQDPDCLPRSQLRMEMAICGQILVGHRLGRLGMRVTRLWIFQQ